MHAFESSQAIWFDSDFIEIQVQSKDEQRFVVIDRITKNHWPVDITYRGNTNRISSVKRSRKRDTTI